ncbi:MAG: polysaccharide biosynthesis protein [Flavobacteriales bacterium]|nr:polysaccharide biosynthesis protein [Flavobacteriales bacterium]|tara:strand:+ start:63594 stop:65462 length:1869 start_codon:yes stop_codon:yes gene_type:complete
MKLRLQNLDRIYKQLIMLLIDVFTLIFALWFSFVLRLGDVFPAEFIFESWWVFLALPFVMIPLFIKLGLYRAVLQYMGIKVITTTFQATTISCLVIGFFMMFFRESNLPRSVLPIFWFIANVFVITSRFLFKGYLYSWDSFVNERKQSIIYGAGNAGMQLVESLKKSVVYAPIAFIDDSKEKHGTILNYLEVFPFEKMEYLIKKKDAKVLLFAIPSVTNKQRTDILKRLTKFPIEVKILPSVDNIVNGVISIDNIKHVEVGDILGRSSVAPKEELLRKNITAKNILITGAGGSIGVELSRQIMKLSPEKVVLVDNAEFNLYSIHLELKQELSNVEVIPALCTITNYNQLKKIILKHEIHTIYHAAAYKHVPMVEMNIFSGVYNNVVGTYNVAKIADELGVESMVLISTDKAVRPTNIMGASKRMSELVLQAYSDSSCCFSMVRFGNVLDSAGSVVPLFRDQIKKGGPLTVTHRNITRYFMSIPEASQLVLQAGAMAKGGDVFVLDMGEPIKIIDLAYKMIHLSGLTPIDNENPDGDIRIEYTGLRPGEKLYEELLIGSDVIQSEHPRIMQAIEKRLDMSTVLSCIDTIKEARDKQDEEIVKELLLKHVDGYTSEISEKTLNL